MALLQLDRKALAEIWPTVEAGEIAFYKLHARQLQGWTQRAAKATAQRAADDAAVQSRQNAALSGEKTTLSESDGDSTESQ